MIASLNSTSSIVAEDFKYLSYQTGFIDNTFKLSFQNQVKLKEILEFVKNPQNDIRFATNWEVFDMINRIFPIENDEVIACLEPEIQIGDQFLAIDINGPKILPVFSIWDNRYRFPVVLC